MQPLVETKSKQQNSLVETITSPQEDCSTSRASCSATRFARKARREVSTETKDLLTIVLAITLTSLVILFIYNGVDQLKNNANHHELIKKARTQRKDQLLLQYDRNRDGSIDEEEAAFASLNTYQI